MYNNFNNFVKNIRYLVSHECQYAFRKNRLTISPVYKFIQNNNQNIGPRTQCCRITTTFFLMIDFRAKLMIKFDMVLSKLYNIGVRGKANK